MVSICCTTYNLEKHISKTLDSILAQETQFQYEVIIHDDASTDNTPEIIKSYAEKYSDLIIPIYQNRNIYSNHEGGLGHIFINYLLPASQGEYIAVCDGDDFWTDSKKLQKQINYLESNDECSACFTNATVVNEITKENNRQYVQLEEGYVPESDIIYQAGSVYPTSTLVFRKKSLTKSKYFNYYDELSKYHRIDTLFIYCLLFEGKIAFLNDCTAIYRRWAGGLFSGIMDDPYKVSRIKEKEIEGNRKLIKIANHKRKKLFKRKISIDSLFVLRTKPDINRLKYFKNLNAKEIVKYLTKL